MANGDDSEGDTAEGGGGAGGADAPARPRKQVDPVVAPALLGTRHQVVHRGRPRWTTVGLVLLFIAALALYLALRPGG